MKQLISLLVLLGCSTLLYSQKYPDPEFSNEVYYLKEDSVTQVFRLEKNSSKLESKTKVGGIGGAESGYEMDGERSRIRLHSGTNLSFVFFTGPVAASGSNPQTDSMMRANGMDPSMMSGMSGNPSDMISLYKAETGKGKRKILMMKMGGMGFGSKKQTSSDKYTFSVRKVREGYWELVIDKTLPKGEYAFSIMGRGVSGMDGSTMLYAFGVD